MSDENTKYGLWMEGDVINFIAKGESKDREGRIIEASSTIQVLFAKAASRSEDAQYEVQDMRVPLNTKRSDFMGKRVRVPVKAYATSSGGDFAEVKFAKIEGAPVEIVHEATFGRVVSMPSRMAPKPEAKVG